MSVSPVLVSADGHGTVDGGTLESLPENVWVTWESQNTGIAGNADRIQRAAAAAGHEPPQMLPVDTMDHSRQLVLNHAEVRDFLVEAIESCAGPS